MILNTRKHNDVLILYPEGKITLGDGDQELGELVGCYTSIKGKGGELRICGMSGKIFSLIKMTSLHSVFEVKDTEDEALAGF